MVDRPIPFSYIDCLHNTVEKWCFLCYNIEKRIKGVFDNDR